MEIIPAIDIREGRCVRLYQGDYEQETVYSEDPVSVAKHWASLGPPRLHVVDLDGALSGKPVNLKIIKTIVKEVAIPVQVGGGIRSLATIESMLTLGVDRVVLGTSAIREPELVAEACRQHGVRIVVGIDARNGMVATSGWQQNTQTPALELLNNMVKIGVKRVIYTDIAKDGTLEGPNFESLRELVSQSSIPIIASGGISKLEHLLQLQQLGVEGAIIGRALYTGDLDLAKALMLC